MAYDEVDSAIDSVMNKESGRSEVDDIIDAQQTSLKTGLQQSAYVSADKNPDRQGKVLELSRKFNMPVDIVDRNYDDFVNDASVPTSEIDDIISKSPRVAEWLKDPQNMAVAKDDLDSLKKIEETVNDHGWASGLIGSIKYGTANFAAGLVKSRALLEKQYVDKGIDPVTGFPTIDNFNPDTGKFNEVSKDYTVPSVAYDNELTRTLEEYAQDSAPAEMRMDIIDEAKKGNYANAGKALIFQAVSNLPQLAFIVASRGRGLTMLATSSAGSKMAENIESGVDPETARANAVATGGIEAAIESIGGIGGNPLKETVKALTKTVGKEGAKEVFKEGFKNVLKGSAVEGFEEFATSLSQDVLDFATDVNPQALEGMLQRAGNSFLVGAAAGGGMITAAEIPSMMRSYESQLKTQHTKEMYLNLEDAVENSKLKKRSPESQRLYVDSITKGTAVENIYIPVEQFETYYQSKKIPPSKAAQEIGVLDKYNEAKETGADVEIPLSQWVDKVSGTEHYKGLADDVKFNPAEQTVNQVKAESEETKKELEAQDVSAQPTAQDEARTKELSEIRNNIRDQLKATGFTHQEANAQSELYRQTFDSLSQRSNMSPAELFGQYGLKIQNVEDVLEYTGQTVMNQSQFSGKPLSKQSMREGIKYQVSRSVDNSLKVEPSEGIKATAKVMTYPALGKTAVIDSFETKAKYKGVTVDMIRSMENAAARTGAESISVTDKTLGKHATTETYNMLKEEGYTSEQKDNGDIHFTKKLEPQVSYNQSKASMKEKAEALGFDTSRVVFHGGPVEITDFKTNSKGANKYLEGVYMTTSENDAGRYADMAKNAGHTSQVYKLYPPKNLLQLDDASAVDKAIVDMGLEVPTKYTKFKYNPEMESLMKLRLAVEGSGVKSKQVDKVVREKLQALGFKGVETENDMVISVFDPKDVRSVDAAFEDGDSTNIYAQDTQELRGQIRFGKDRKFYIDLLKGKDRSTFIHESGHFFLEVMGDLAQNEKASQGLKDDYQALLKWLGVESRDQIKTEHHEQFARGFEAYLMEGKAPSSSLRKAFNTIKIWLTDVYRHFANLHVELNDDIRGVMDRLVATEQEIDQAYAEMGFDYVPDPKSMGMSEAQAARYLEAREEARIAAEDKIRSQLMKDVIKKQSAEYKAKKKELMEQVTNEVNSMPAYRAESILKTGKFPDGTDSPTEVKLSRQSVVDVYGKDFVKTLPKGIFAEDGLHFDMAAEALGFESGDAMVQSLSDLKKKTELIESMVETQMKEQFPELLASPEISDEAMQAVHNDKRSKVLRMELEHLAKHNLPSLKDVIRKVVRRVPAEKVVREQAAQIIAGKQISEIRPIIYQRAEIKAAKEAGQILAKGDIDGAFEAKRRELLNHELYRAAIEAKERVSKDVKNFRKFFKSDEDLSKSRDIDMVNAARAVLAEFGITRSEKSADDYLQNLKSYDPDTYESVMAIIESATENVGHYKSIKFDDFVAMSDAISALWDLAKSSREIEIDGQKMDRDVIKQEMSDRLSEVSGNSDDGAQYKKAATAWDKTKMNLLGIRAALRRVESWADAIDGSKRTFTKYMVQPIVEATAQYRLAKKKTIQGYLEVVKKLDRKSLNKKPIDAPELGYQFKDKAELLGALLHSGNESNLAKLLLGGQRGSVWGVRNEDGSLDRSKWDAFIQRMWSEGVLTKSDYEFAQGVWDLNESLKPDAQKAHKKMYGYYFNEITAHEVQTPFGNYRGGYVPAVADTLQSQDSAIRSEKEALERNNNSFMFPTAGRGFTKSRVDAYVAPLSLDLGMVPSHIDKVLRFTHIEPRVKEVGRIVMNREFRKSLDAFDPTIGGDMLVPWLQRAAQQRVSMPSGTGRAWAGADNFFRGLRARAGLQVMTANVTNAFQQFTGLSIAALKVKPKYLRNALWQYVRSPKQTTLDITEKSDYMKSKLTGSAMEVMDTIDEILTNPTKYEQAIDFAKKHGYFLQQGTQNIVDSMVWSGAYNEAVERGMEEREAVRHADAQVRLTQGTLAPEDVSRFETGSPFMRMFTQFYSYFNMQANLLGTEYQKTMRDLGLRKGAGRMAYIYTMGFMIPAFMSELIVRAMSGQGFDEDDDDQYLDDFMSMFFGSQFRSGLAMAPVVGQTALVGVNTFNNKWYDDRISTSPSISMVESLLHAPKSVYDAIHNKGKENRAIKDTLTALGLMTGIPLAPLARPITYLNDVSSGKAKPSGPVDFTRGLVTGKRGD